MSAPGGTGHVFVARGSLELIDADAVVVPTDAYFTVESRWDGLWAAKEAPTEPAGWGLKSVANWDEAPAAGPAIWFIDVAVHKGESPDQVIEKIIIGTRKIFHGCADISKQHKRSRPLIALPTLGVGLGGLNEVRGELITRLLQSCASGSDEFGIDIAVVAYDPADYAAFQYLRRQASTAHGVGLPPDLDQAARTLAQKVKSGDLALFIGAGVSMSAGLPSWEELVKQLERHIPAIEPGHGLNALDLAELIAHEDDHFRQHVVEAISGATRPGLSHLLLASLGCDEVVTTNFDLLYEKAANYRTTETTGTTVLPWRSRQERGPWLLKMHGDTSRPKSIVLSRSDFIDYDAASGPAGAAVQALMLLRHILVVGASLTDDNFLRLAHEVTRFLEANKAPTRQFGTVLSFGPETARKRLYKDTFDYVDTDCASLDDDQPRASAIFLDALAMYASKDAGFLLDPRYRSLLSGQTAQAVMAIASAIPAITLASSDGDDPMGELWKMLQLFGASDD